MAENESFRQRIDRTETLIREIDQLGDPATQTLVHQLVQTIMDFHGEGLSRMVDQLAHSSDPSLIQTLADDELIGSLLVLYGLHPLDLETRVMQALDKVRPLLHSHGGDVELLGIEEGVVRLRLDGSCHGCPSSSLTLRNAIEQAIYETAADVARLDVVGGVDQPPAGFVPLEAIKQC